jgi:hypothetical protein
MTRPLAVLKFWSVGWHRLAMLWAGHEPKKRYRPRVRFQLAAMAVRQAVCLEIANQITANPDDILKLFDVCPACGSRHLEALTWKSRGSDAVTVGCWSCGWLIEPPGNPDSQPTA